MTSTKLSMKQRIQLLFEKELYSNVVKIVGIQNKYEILKLRYLHIPIFQCDLILSLGEKKYDYFDELHITKYHADSLFALGQYFNAEKYYKKCIMMRKEISSNKHMKSSEKCNDLPKDADLKYKAHSCLLSLNQRNEALEVLQSIKCKHRDAKINMALGTLLMENGKDRLAAGAFKEVLEECPLSIEAAENLLKLGIKVKI